MAVQVVFQLLKTVAFFFVNIWRRALCCFRRRRRMSDSIPLTAVGVVADYGKPGTSTELENWNSWNESIGNFKPNSVQEHIELYRQQAMKQHSPDPEPETQQDFFQDMTPRITRQTKLLIDHGDSTDDANNESSRLALAPQPIVAEGELGEWEENSGWEAQTQSDWDTQSILREKRRQERERRLWEQQQRRQEKVVRPLSLGAKIS